MGLGINKILRLQIHYKITDSKITDSKITLNSKIMNSKIQSHPSPKTSLGIKETIPVIKLRIIEIQIQNSAFSIQNSAFPMNLLLSQDVLAQRI